MCVCVPNDTAHTSAAPSCIAEVVDIATFTSSVSDLVSDSTRTKTKKKPEDRKAEMTTHRLGRWKNIKNE